VAVAGFSDGASYALSLGLTNGDLFSDVLAFSPGFHAEDRRQGRPRFYLSHGVHDEVLPIVRTSRRIVPGLRSDGYQVTYREFDGGHVVPAECVAEAAEGLWRP
jgi:predicted esterase